LSAQVSKGQSEGTWVRLECGFCGAKGGQYVLHYGLLRCSCGRIFWALRPGRASTLVLLDQAKAEMRERGLPLRARHVSSVSSDVPFFL
jgi:hypothetical protein